MRAGWVRSLAFILCLSAWTAAHAWDTRVSGGLGDSDWRSIYELLPEPGNGQVVIHGNEHAEISATALNAIGAGVLLGTDDLPVVTDLNASYFRRDLLFGKQPRQPADAPNDGLERRILPPPAQFSGLPDFSYSLYDWINKNQLCPLPPDTPERDKCHNYNGWIGAALNASHFGTQAALNYKRLHKIALSLADRARGLRLKLRQTPGALQAYRRHLAEAEWMALAYEGVAQHFLADRWSTGHMWERWNAGDYEHLASRDLLVNKLVGYISGMFHGMQTVLHARLSGRSAAHHLWPDPLSSPVVEIERQDGVVERLWNYYVGGESGRITLKSVDPAVFRHAGGGPANPGIGDYGFRDLLDGDFGGREYGFENELPLPLPAQRGEMMSCVQGGWADVIRALGKNPKGGYGILPIPLKEDAPSLVDLGERCFDAYVTNRSMMLAWPFSRPTFWSQLGRATLTVLSSDAGVAALEQLGKGNPLSAKAVKVLKQTYKTQLAAGRQAARNMVRLSYLAWRQGRRNPGGTDLARGGLGALDFSSGETRKKPEVFVGGENIIEPGDRYKAAAYFPRDDLAGLPKQNDAAGRDKEAVYGFFSRAMADHWGHQLPEILPELRGARSPWKQALCEYLADMAYNGTDPAYQGSQKEVRTADGRRDGRPVPSWLSALGVQLDAARVPVYLPPGYVGEPYTRTGSNRTYRSVQAWCARMPVLHLLEVPEYRDRDVVATAQGAGVDVVLQGADLGAERGQVWVGCEFGERRVALEIRSWKRSAVTVRVPGEVAEGSHSLCLRRADGTGTAGRYVLDFKPGAPQVTLVEIQGRGETWYRQPGGVDKPLGGGTYSLMVEFDQAMDREWPARVTVHGPGGLRLREGEWITERRWQARLDVPDSSTGPSIAHGEHPLEITARSGAGFTLDADPAEPGDQPEQGYRFRVGGGTVAAGFVGCFRNPADDAAALEIGKDGHALALLYGGKVRFPLLASMTPDNELVLRHDFNPETFREYYRHYDGAVTGLVEKSTPTAPGFTTPWVGRCTFHLDGPTITCPGEGDAGGDQQYRVNVQRSYVEWRLILDARAASDEMPPPLRVTRFNANLQTWNGGSYAVSDTDLSMLDDRMRTVMGGQVMSMMQGTDRGGVRIARLDDLFAGYISDRPARIQRVLVVDAGGSPVGGPLSSDTSFRVRAEGTSHCPGIRESVPVSVTLPGESKPVRIDLQETGPDTGVFEGPETPLRASLPQSMPRGHLRIVTDAELRSRLGWGGISFNGDPEYRKKSVGTSFSVEVRRGEAPPLPMSDWRTYSLEVKRMPGRTLPDIFVIETQYQSNGRTASLIRNRYPVSITRGSANGVALWSVSWHSPGRMEETKANGPAGFARLVKRAAALRQDGFSLDRLPDRIAGVLKGESRPLNQKWQPQAAQKSKATEASGKTSDKVYTYQGPPYQAVRVAKHVPKQFAELRRSRVYVMPGRSRSESRRPRGSVRGIGKMVNIVREDLGLAWDIFEETGTYVERPYKPSKLVVTFEQEETVDGKRLRRYRFEAQDGGIKVEGKVWKDEHGIPIHQVQRIDIPGAGVQEEEHVLENVRIGPLDESLFELPPGYTPASGL